MTKRFPSTVRFRLRRHPNRVHLTRSNVIRRNTAAPSPSSSPLLSLVLGATLAKSAPPSRVHFSHPPRGPRSIQPAASLRCPPSETELRHGRTEPASCTMPARGAPCWSWWMLSRVSAPWTRVHAGCNPCHPPNRIPPFHRLLPDRNFPPSKFSIPQFPTTTTIPPSSTCFSIKSHTLQKQYIHIYIYFFFFFLPFISMSSFEGWLEPTVVVIGTLEGGGLMTDRRWGRIKHRGLSLLRRCLGNVSIVSSIPMTETYRPCNMNY